MTIKDIIMQLSGALLPVGLEWLVDIVSISVTVALILFTLKIVTRFLRY